jgi:hypothetical protein
MVVFHFGISLFLSGGTEENPINTLIVVACVRTGTRYQTFLNKNQGFKPLGTDVLIVTVRSSFVLF